MVKGVTQATQKLYKYPPSYSFRKQSTLTPTLSKEFFWGYKRYLAPLPYSTWALVSSFWGHKIGRQEQTHNRAASGLVHARRPKEGVSLFVNSIEKRGTTLFSREQGNYTVLSLSQGWNLTRDGILTRRQRVITKQRPKKNDEGAKLPKAQDHCHLG